MKLEDQVVSLNLAKRLKELKCKQGSLYSWIYNTEETEHIKSSLALVQGYTSELDNMYSAYTASELFEMIPKWITLDESHAPFENYAFKLVMFNTVECSKEKEFSDIRNYRITYECDSTETQGENAWLVRQADKPIFDSNLCNALAKTLIWLIEEKYLMIK